MIRNKFGRTVKLISFCGLHTPQGDQAKLSLCKAKLTFARGTEHESTRTRFVFLERLQADNGMEEIYGKLSELPYETLEGENLRWAIADAS